jgi:hypothetical protein
MSENQQIHDIINTDYKLGFETLVQSDTFAKGLNEDVIRAISAKKEQTLQTFRENLEMLKMNLKVYDKKEE